MSVTRRASVPAFPTDGSVKTLGFDVMEWCEEYLLHPSGTLDEAFRLTGEQLDFVLWWYAVDPGGRFLNRRGVLRRSKGWGKSPFLGAIALAELCGPVRFGGWLPDGEPNAVPHPSPWVVIAGVSEAQAANTFDAVRTMAGGQDLADAYALDVGRTQILYPSGNGKIVPLTASASTQEGARYTFAIMDEVHWWTDGNKGKALHNVIQRNLGKTNQRGVVTTNAHDPAVDSVGRELYAAHLAAREGRTRRDDVLYDSLEAQGLVSLADEVELLAALKIAYGDATWVDLDRIMAEIYDLTVTPEDARRFYLNEIVASADAWVSADEWSACVRPELEPLAEGEYVTLGFDGALTDDSTALVAVRVSDGAPTILGLWEKPLGPAGNGWEIDKGLVRGSVDSAFSRYKVLGFFSDLAYWETDVDTWRETYGERLRVKATTSHAVAWDMRGHLADTTRAAEALHRAILDGELPHDDEPRLRRHVLNARRRPNRWGLSFGKASREDPNKIDALAALLLARMARTRVLADGVPEAKVPGTFYSF